METAPLKSFATKARTDLMKEVAARLDVVLAPGSNARAEQPGAVAALEHAVAQTGREAVVDRVAYTWFNRIIALRFMDAKGYTGIGVVSPEAGKSTGQPQVLSDAKGGDFDIEVVAPKTQAAVSALLAPGAHGADPQGAAYGLLLEAYSRYWNKAMPFMFEREGDYTELLMPTGLLSADSVRGRAVVVLTEEVCDDVEVIGWLYQFYISERKDEVFEGFKKNKKAGAAEIPAATQLFTPHWIVRYLVENSLGRLWLLNHPQSRLAEQMDYYIAPVEEETDFLKVSRPEELKVVDPAAGSGHMLTYAFDLLYAIYEEEGYTPSEIPGLILGHNLYGTEIDRRAGSLAAFALTMKAAARRKLFLKNPVQPNICVLENVSFDPSELDYLWSLTSRSLSARNETKGIARADADEFLNAFEHADTFGSLIRPKEQLVASLRSAVENVASNGDLLHSRALDKANRVIEQATYLSQRYSVAVANPPYMGSKQMNDLLSQFMKDEYRDVKQDLYGAFVIRGTELADRAGLLAIVIGDTWMSIKSFEELRLRLLDGHSFDSFVHIRDVSNHPDIFGANAAFVLSMVGDRQRHAPFIRLTPLGQERKEENLRAALKERIAEAGFHLASGEDFATIPGSPIVYWLSEKMRAAFSTGRPLSEVANLRQGMATADNSRFLRQWWEVSRDRTAFACESREAAAASGARWFPYNKGGEFRKWYGNQEHVVNWEHDGAEIVAFKPRSVIRNPGTYFSPSVSWSKISSGAPAFRYYPPGFIFDVAGTSIFAASSQERLALLSFANSQLAFEQLAAIAPTLNFEVGQVAGLPIADSTAESGMALAARAVETAQADWNTLETSWAFERNPLIEIAAHE